MFQDSVTTVTASERMPGNRTGGRYLKEAEEHGEVTYRELTLEQRAPELAESGRRTQLGGIAGTLLETVPYARTERIYVRGDDGEIYKVIRPANNRRGAREQVEKFRGYARLGEKRAIRVPERLVLTGIQSLDTTDDYVAGMEDAIETTEKNPTFFLVPGATQTEMDSGEVRDRLYAHLTGFTNAAEACRDPVAEQTRALMERIIPATNDYSANEPVEDLFEVVSSD